MRTLEPQEIEYLKKMLKQRNKRKRTRETKNRNLCSKEFRGRTTNFN